MPLKINGIELSNPDNLTEQKWFSHIKQLVREMNYGTVNIKITAKKGEVTHMKVISEQSISIHNS